VIGCTARSGDGGLSIAFGAVTPILSYTTVANIIEPPKASSLIKGSGKYARP
jgi:hypothetical protein